MIEKMNNGERMAFEHATRLVKQYREELKLSRLTITIQRVFIIILTAAFAAFMLYERFNH